MPHIDIQIPAVREMFIQYNTYLLLKEFEVGTVSYRPSFFPFDLGPKREARGLKSTGKNEDP